VIGKMQTSAATDGRTFSKDWMARDHRTVMRSAEAYWFVDLLKFDCVLSCCVSVFTLPRWHVYGPLVRSFVVMGVMWFSFGGIRVFGGGKVMVRCAGGKAQLISRFSRGMRNSSDAN